MTLPLTKEFSNSAIVELGHDRRSSTRMRTVYRVAHVQSSNDEGLAWVRDISDGGVKLDTVISVRLGDMLVIRLSETITLSGNVIWINGRACGVKFEEPIDSVALLRDLIEEIRSGRARPPRMSASLPVTISGLRKTFETRMVDVSQGGLKVSHDGQFMPGLRVKVAVGAGVEKAGFVCWARDKMAGIKLADHFSVDELGSMQAFAT